MQFPLSKLCVYEPQTSTLPIKVLLSPPPKRQLLALPLSTCRMLSESHYPVLNLSDPH